MAKAERKNSHGGAENSQPGVCQTGIRDVQTLLFGTVEAKAAGVFSERTGHSLPIVLHGTGVRRQDVFW